MQGCLQDLLRDQIHSLLRKRVRFFREPGLLALTLVLNKPPRGNRGSTLAGNVPLGRLQRTSDF